MRAKRKNHFERAQKFAENRLVFPLQAISGSEGDGYVSVYCKCNWTHPHAWNINLSHSLSVVLIHQSWSLLMRPSYHLGQKLQWSGFCFLGKVNRASGTRSFRTGPIFWSNLLNLRLVISLTLVSRALKLTMPSFACKVIFLKVP